MAFTEHTSIDGGLASALQHGPRMVPVIPTDLVGGLRDFENRDSGNQHS